MSASVLKKKSKEWNLDINHSDFMFLDEYEEISKEDLRLDINFKNEFVFSEDQKGLIDDCIQKGWGANQIAKAISVSVDLVEKYIKSKGIGN